jgi:hypothetical protein
MKGTLICDNSHLLVHPTPMGLPLRELMFWSICMCPIQVEYSLLEGDNIFKGPFDSCNVCFGNELDKLEDEAPPIHMGDNINALSLSHLTHPCN